MGPVHGRSVLWGVTAAVAMATGYAALVGGLSGSTTHLLEQVRADWYLLGPIIAGFGLQVGLVVELRRRRRALRAAAATGATGAGGSTLGMVACCAHHVADVAPMTAATGAATFLGAHRAWFMAAGLAVTAVSVTVAATRLRHLPADPRSREDVACAAH